jgi:hypothetical protein
MNSKNKVIIFDLWQTLADSALKPSDLFDSLFKLDNTISKNDFLKILFESDLYLKDMPLKEGLESFLSDLSIFNKKKLETTISLWKEMIQKSFLIDGSEAVLTAYYRKNIEELPTHCRQLLKKDVFDLLACQNEKCRIIKSRKSDICVY